MKDPFSYDDLDDLIEEKAEKDAQWAIALALVRIAKQQSRIADALHALAYPAPQR